MVDFLTYYDWLFDVSFIFVWKNFLKVEQTLKRAYTFLFYKQFQILAKSCVGYRYSVLKLLRYLVYFHV